MPQINLGGELFKLKFGVYTQMDIEKYLLANMPPGTAKSFPQLAMGKDLLMCDIITLLTFAVRHSHPNMTVEEMAGYWDDYIDCLAEAGYDNEVVEASHSIITASLISAAQVGIGHIPLKVPKLADLMKAIQAKAEPPAETEVKPTEPEQAIT